MNVTGPQIGGTSNKVKQVIANKKGQHEVIRLQQELLTTKAELQKVNDQLNCLILLVKRAWTGDNAAATHVANIVGVAPPDIKEDSLGGRVMLSAKPKSRAVNNWAVLTIKLLHTQYAELERQVQKQQKMYLQSRQNFLEEQLILHRNLVTKSGQHKRTNTGETVNELFLKNKNDGRPASARRKMKHLYQEPKDRVEVADVTWADLLIEPADRDAASKKPQDNIFHMTADGNEGEEYFVSDPDRTKITYDDSSKYSKTSMYNSDVVVGTKKKRPVSAFIQRTNDAVRARPRSAVNQKTERPLKYETTRPITATIKGKSDNINTTNTPPNKLSPGKRHVNFTPPDVVVQYEKDEKDLEKLESDVKQTYMRLQGKLGIPYGARVT